MLLKYSVTSCPWCCRRLVIVSFSAKSTIVSSTGHVPAIVKCRAYYKACTKWGCGFIARDNDVYEKNRRESKKFELALTAARLKAMRRSERFDSNPCVTTISPNFGKQISRWLRSRGVREAL